MSSEAPVETPTVAEAMDVEVPKTGDSEAAQPETDTANETAAVVDTPVTVATAEAAPEVLEATDAKAEEIMAEQDASEPTPEPGDGLRLKIGIKLPKVNVILTRCDDKLAVKQPQSVEVVDVAADGQVGQAEPGPSATVILPEEPTAMEEDGSERLDLLNGQENDLNSRLDTSE